MSKPTLPQAAYSLDLNDGHPVFAYSAQQMYDFADKASATLGVPIPTNEDQAVLMCILGYNWVRDNAPHRLSQMLSAQPNPSNAVLASEGK